MKTAGNISYHNLHSTVSQASSMTLHYKVAWTFYTPTIDLGYIIKLQNSQHLSITILCVVRKYYETRAQCVLRTYLKAKLSLYRLHLVITQSYTPLHDHRSAVCRQIPQCDSQHSTGPHCVQLSAPPIGL